MSERRGSLRVALAERKGVINNDSLYLLIDEMKTFSNSSRSESLIFERIKVVFDCGVSILDCLNVRDFLK